jgi:flagellar basal-body rod modification protein FlgD
MSTIASSLSGLNGATPTGTPAAAADPLTSENTFLQLLVAQIRNQDPTNPTDATQFVGQLTQYSQLEQLMQINQGLTKAEAPPAAATPAK